METFFEERMMIKEIVDEIIYQVITGKPLEFPGGEVEIPWRCFEDDV